MEFISLPQKRGLSNAVSGNSFSSSKMWTIICNFWNFFPFSKNMDYHMQFLEFHSHLQERGLSYTISGISYFSFSKNVDYHMQFVVFIFLLLKHALSYAISENPFPSQKTWTIICNL